MHNTRLFRALLATILCGAFVLGQVTWALAGTTGGLRITVTDDQGTPVSGASVKVISASQIAEGTTDSAGHVSFINLAPDTYSILAEKAAYTRTPVGGVAVFADQQLTLVVRMPKYTEITHVVSTRPGSLLKSGAPNDIYSVDATVQNAVQGIGGGNNINSMISGLAATPGVQTPLGGAGWGQTVFIRGSAYDQVGYEYDGVPVNRAFDNYNSSTTSNLGQQELQVYTGGGPAGSSSASIGGFINQVIKTGTYPGFGSGAFGAGVPSFYHNLRFEAGGATPNRLFSWYAGVSGYNQAFRALNDQDGGNLDPGGGSFGLIATQSNPLLTIATPWYTNGTYANCNPDGSSPTGAQTFAGSPVCLAYSPYAFNLLSNISDREAVANFHFAIPHRSGTGRDDVQILYSGGSIHTTYSDSQADVGGAAQYNRLAYGNAAPGDTSANANICGLIGALLPGNFSSCPTTGNAVLPYADGYSFPGATFGQSATGMTASTYYFPGSSANRAAFSPIPVDARGTIWNDQQIVKVQYTKNLGSSAYARLFAYTDYSDWLQNDPNFAINAYGLNGILPTGGGQSSADYELSTHTRGAEFQFADQINAQNFLRFTANFTNASVTRWNNSSWRSGLGGSYGRPTNLVNLSTGICYDYKTGAPASCFSSASAGTYTNPTRGGAIPAAAAAAGASWVVTTPGDQGTLNTVSPTFTSYAIEDELRPSDRLDLNLSVRFENFNYKLANANNPEFNFWFREAALSYCVDPATKLPETLPLKAGQAPPATIATTAPGGICPNTPSSIAAGNPTPGVHPGQAGTLPFTNLSDSSLNEVVVSPRISGTYTLNPDTVLRLAFGKYAQPTNTAFVQYLNASGKQAAVFDFQNFYGLGFNSPEHNFPVQTSYNYDASLEKHIKGTDLTFKFSPFYRLTQGETVAVTLGPSFVSGLNVGLQKSSGLEFQLQKGDPNKDGLSGAISYTFTNTRIKYNNGPNGQNVIDVLNNYIGAYNGLAGNGGAPCYLGQVAQTAAACAADIASGKPQFTTNPYFGKGAQPLLDRGAYYEFYPNAPPGDPGSDAFTAIRPNLFSGFLNYKHDKFTITPNFTLGQGPKYGSPTSIVGVDPRSCANLNATRGVTGAAGQEPDYQSCNASQATATGNFAIPNPYTGSFDSMGQYRAPWQLNIGTQLSYQVTPRVQATLILTNLVNRCFGGDKPAWAQKYQPNQYVCGYFDNTNGYTGSGPNATPYAGFYYPSASGVSNGTVAGPATNNYPYTPVPLAIPFQAYFSLQFKL